MTRKGRLLDRRVAAALVTAEFYTCTKRATERWQIPGRLINGRVHMYEEDIRHLALETIARSPATSPAPARKDR